MAIITWWTLLRTQIIVISIECESKSCKLNYDWIVFRWRYGLMKSKADNACAHFWHQWPIHMLLFNERSLNRYIRFSFNWKLDTFYAYRLEQGRMRDGVDPKRMKGRANIHFLYEFIRPRLEHWIGFISTDFQRVDKCACQDIHSKKKLTLSLPSVCEPHDSADLLHQRIEMLEMY